MITLEQFKASSFAKMPATNDNYCTCLGSLGITTSNNVVSMYFSTLRDHLMSLFTIIVTDDDVVNYANVNAP